jgi:hypothetical protein
LTLPLAGVMDGWWWVIVSPYAGYWCKTTVDMEFPDSGADPCWEKEKIDFARVVDIFMRRESMYISVGDILYLNSTRPLHFFHT